MAKKLKGYFPVRYKGKTRLGKHCSKCKVLKALLEYYRSESVPGGRRRQCIQCEHKAAGEYIKKIHYENMYADEPKEELYEGWN